MKIWYKGEAFGGYVESFLFYIKFFLKMEKSFYTSLDISMSGSPIIQDGKMVGAVTHVLVNDPMKGYGVFIETMLAQ